MPETGQAAPGERRLANLGVVWRFAARYPGRIGAAFVMLVTASLATLGIPWVFGRVVDRGFTAANGYPISFYFWELLAMVALLALASSLRFYFVSWLGERVVADIRRAVQANLLRLAPRFFEENRPSEIASRLTADTTLIEQVVGTTVSVALRNTFTGIGGLIYLFTISAKLTGMLLLVIPIVIVPISLLGRRLRVLSRLSQDRIADIGTTASETLSAMKIVQAFTQEQRETERFGTAVENNFAVARRRIRLRAALTAMVFALVGGSIVFVLWQGASDVAAHRLSGGAIASFVFTAMIVAGAAGALTEVYGDLLRGAGAAGRLTELLATRADITAPAKPVPLPMPARGAVEFDHVSFQYPTRPNQSALADVSLSVAPGETVALVGPSGAGKTTVFQLLERFYDPQSGSIRLDGVVLPEADPAEIRGRIAMVPQESVIFAASARDNLRYGRWDADDDAIWTAAEAANAAGFLRALPQGLDTYLGEGGARLSGGQRQRLSIARAVLRDAPLLLLDEATSALDAESEQLVQQALERLMDDRTTIVIAHRLATVRRADRIIVLDEGRIVEQGRHDTLLAEGGLYARLARLQFDDAA
jgi:ATP-binding cassette subfamily B protein